MHVALRITGVIHRYLYYRETLLWIEWKIKDLLHANSYIFGDREATVLVQKFVAKKQEKERIVFIWGGVEMIWACAIAIGYSLSGLWLSCWCGFEWDIILGSNVLSRCIGLTFTCSLSHHCFLRITFYFFAFASLFPQLFVLSTSYLYGVEQLEQNVNL